MIGAARQATCVLDVRSVPGAADGEFWRAHLSDAEIAPCMTRRNAHLHLAARLAAKRACRHALVLGDGVAHHDLVMEPLVGAAQSITVTAPGRSPRTAQVSMSHVHGWAGAMVLAAGGDRSQRRRWAVGFDLLDLARWRLAVERSGRSLLDRVCSPAEGDDSRLRAGLRFSIKECVIKAIGGLPRGASFHDIVVDLRDGRSVQVDAGGAVARLLHTRGLEVQEAGVRQLHRDVAQTAVVLRGR